MHRGRQTSPVRSMRRSKVTAPSGRLGLVLFVTDGEPTVGERDPEAIAARVARLRKDRRIFSFGVGAELNAALVERLALEGRGTAQFVRPNESVERAVSIVASRLTNPVVTDVRVYADGVRLLKRSHRTAADIFAGQDFVLLTRYDRERHDASSFRGRDARTGRCHGRHAWYFRRASRENSFIARLWATQRVGYFSAEKRRNGGSSEDRRRDSRARREVRDTDGVHFLSRGGAGNGARGAATRRMSPAVQQSRLPQRHRYRCRAEASRKRVRSSP